MKILVLCLVLLFPSATWADVAYVTNSSGTADDVTSLTISHTCTGTNRFLIVGITHRTTITGVTYNTVALTQLGSTLTADGKSLDIWSLIAPANGSAHNVVISSSAGIFGHAVALCFTGVHQTTALGAQSAGADGFTSSATATVTGVANGMVVDFVMIEANAPTPDGSQTQRFNATYYQYLAASTKVGTGSVAMSWTFTADYNELVAVPILPVAAAAMRRAAILIQ